MHDDLLLHVLVSYAIALIDPAIALLAGVVKEISDLFGNGVADLRDLFANALGILLAGSSAFGAT